MPAGGFGGMLAALVVMTVMYIGLCYSIAEMSPALPHAGGAYSFARTSMGPWAGYITGLAENMEYILTPAVIVVGIGGYLGAVFGTPASWQPFWWLVCYGLFVALNIWGVEMTFFVSLVVTLIALAVLVVFWAGAVPHFDLARWATPYFPPGVSPWKASVVQLPFALWLYLGIEQLPLAAEESHDPKKDLPRGILSGLLTLVSVAFLTVVLSAGIAPGAAQIATSNEPLFLGFQTIFGAGLKAKCIGAGGLRRPDRQLPHHHLRLRKADLLAVARGLFPDLAVGDPRRAPDAAPRAAGGLGAGLRGGAGDLPDAAGWDGRSGAAQHGGVRRGDGVHSANGLVHRAAVEVSRTWNVRTGAGWGWPGRRLRELSRRRRWWCCS